MSDMERLNPAHLYRLPAEVGRPGYDRSQVKQGVVHLGIGAFHRAHQAAAFEACLEAGDLRWGIIGASLRSRGVADQLNPQGGLYTLSVRGQSGAENRIMGAVDRVIVAPEDPAALLEAMAGPDVHLITLTITEKGYMLDPATGALMTDNADVAHDCNGPADPRTGPGFVAKALELRRNRGCPPLTVLSCDNLPHNGARLRQAVCAIAREWDASLADWIEETVAFPQTMIDRIVPATTPDDLDQLAALTGYRDEGMVKTEPFTQWVIEDSFAGERPDFSAAPGVQITSSVGDWERAKLRLLNGSHSTMAYLGALAGIDHIHEVVARPAAGALVERLWDEAQTTLDPPSDLDIPAYRAELMARFANPSLAHRTKQIAMDGSQKLPQRLLESIEALYEQGQQPEMLTLGVAAWMQWVTGATTDAGEAIVVDDPMAARFSAIAEADPAPAARVAALLEIGEIFPRTLATNPAFRERLVVDVSRLSGGYATAALAG